MSVIDAIKKRRSNGMIEDRDVPRELIEKILDAAGLHPGPLQYQPLALPGPYRGSAQPLGQIYGPVFCGETNQTRTPRRCRPRSR